MAVIEKVWYQSYEFEYDAKYIRRINRSLKFALSFRKGFDIQNY